jgi:hypothetical protein
LQVTLQSPTRPAPALGDGRRSVIVVAEGVLLDATRPEAALAAVFLGERRNLASEIVPFPEAVAALGAVAASREVVVAIDGDQCIRTRLLQDFRRIPLLAVGPAHGRSPLENAIQMVEDPDTLVVAAAPSQLRLAAAAELPSIGVRTGGYPAQALRRAGAGWVADDIGEVARVLAVTPSQRSSRSHQRAAADDNWRMEVA